MPGRDRSETRNGAARAHPRPIRCGRLSDSAGTAAAAAHAGRNALAEAARRDSAPPALIQSRAPHRGASRCSSARHSLQQDSGETTTQVSRKTPRLTWFCQSTGAALYCKNWRVPRYTAPHPLRAAGQSGGRRCASSGPARGLCAALHCAARGRRQRR